MRLGSVGMFWVGICGDRVCEICTAGQPRGVQFPLW